MSEIYFIVIIHFQALIVIASVVYFLFRSRRLLIKFISFFVLLSSPYLLKLSTVLNRLGIDSYREVVSPSFDELYFYLETLIYNLDKYTNSYIVSIFVIVYFISIIHFLCKIKIARISINIISISIVIFNTTNLIIDVRKGVAEHSNLERNYKEYNIEAISTPEPIDIIVIIGESTTSMNMGLYGYFRKTTPYLSSLAQSKNFRFYDHIHSTHTHTSPSLLEALSIPAEKNTSMKFFKDIYNQERYSIIDVLIKHGISTSLYNNQNPRGSWSYANSIIFKNIDKKINTKEGVTIGNWESESSLELFDHMLIDSYIDEIASNSGVSFIHTYSGHGSYCKNIPSNFRVKVDDFLNDIPTTSVVGLSSVSIKNIECYDAAVRYIDSNIEKIIEAVKSSEKPKIVLYFSDHGESVYTGFGHDSSRFRFEMIKVPFILYANNSYLKNHDLNLIDNIINNSQDLSLIPYLIFEILGIEGGEYHQDDFILIRNIDETKKYIDLSSTQNDYWLLNQYIRNRKSNDSKVCLHRANTIARLVRGRVAFDCLELDIVVDEKSLLVRHDPLEMDDTKPIKNELTLSKVIKTGVMSDKVIWIDGKNIDKYKNCTFTLGKLTNVNFDYLIEFPSDSIKNIDELSDCIHEFRKVAKYTSYYIPTDLLLACNNENLTKCNQLEEIIKKVNFETNFDSISFDYRGYDAIIKLLVKLDVDLNLHAWNILDLNDPKLDRIQLKIVSSELMDNPF